MTFEKITADLARKGWHIWNLTEGTRGDWSCRLYCRHAEPAGQRGVCGYDREDAWRYGVGPNPVAAIAAAAGDIVNMQKEDDTDIDLAALLR